MVFIIRLSYNDIRTAIIVEVSYENGETLVIQPRAFVQKVTVQGTSMGYSEGSFITTQCEITITILLLIDEEIDRAVPVEIARINASSVLHVGAILRI